MEKGTQVVLKMENITAMARMTTPMVLITRGIGKTIKRMAREPSSMHWMTNMWENFRTGGPMAAERIFGAAASGRLTPIRVSGRMVNRTGRALVPMLMALNTRVNGRWGENTAKGDRYVGEWQYGDYHGQGTYTWADGDWGGARYEGEFKNCKKNGRGILTMPNGDVYEGEWVNEEMFGVGTKTSADGTVAYVVAKGNDFVVVEEKQETEVRRQN
jgi:hypothetical protein